MHAKAETADDRNAYRQRLEELVIRLSSGVAELETEALRPTGPDGTAADSPGTEPVHSKSEADEEIAWTILMSEGQLLTEAKAALERLRSGQFGRCEHCGRTISKISAGCGAVRPTLHRVCPNGLQKERLATVSHDGAPAPVATKAGYEHQGG